MRGRTNKLFKSVGRESREIRNISELVRTKLNTFCWVEKVEAYQSLAEKVETDQKLVRTAKICQFFVEKLKFKPSTSTQEKFTTFDNWF